MRLHRQFESARRRLGWSHTDVAQRSGLDPELVADFEFGMADLPSDELDALAAGYGVSLVAVPGRLTTAAGVAGFVGECLEDGRIAAASDAVVKASDVWSSRRRWFSPLPRTRPTTISMQRFTESRRLGCETSVSIARIGWRARRRSDNPHPAFRRGKPVNVR